MSKSKLVMTRDSTLDRSRPDHSAGAASGVFVLLHTNRNIVLYVVWYVYAWSVLKYSVLVCRQLTSLV